VFSVSSKLYVGNLALDVNTAQLQELFAAQGEVVKSRVSVDRETGEPRGFGFVEMAQDADARKAISSLNGHSFRGCDLEVRLAKPRMQAREIVPPAKGPAIG
jgi:RNA recognition motif-containing protein